MEKHVTSLEWSKKLKKAGWEKETIFYWVHPFQKFNYREVLNRWIITDERGLCNHSINFPAPLATELLEELTVDEIKKYMQFMVDYTRDEDWEIRVIKLFKDTNALAAMWCYLKEPYDTRITPYSYRVWDM